MKHFGIIVLSILVLYAGAAWALEKCWDREVHADHPASGAHHHSHSSLGHSYPSDDSLSLSLIHCFSVTNQVGPATTTATTRLSRPPEGVPLFRSDLILPLLMGLSGPRSLIALSRNLTFSFHAGIPHHLYLSVLHI
jgi:hypothetical protein